MTQPRMWLPGVTYFVTHTVRNRQFLLNPSPIVNQILLYCLFRAAKATNVEVHALSVQSNHIHMVVTDHDAVLSEFMQQFDRPSACCLIEHYGQTHPEQYLDGVWAHKSFGAGAVVDEHAAYKELLYTWMNPVKDGMVREYRQWPGLSSRPGDWLKPVRWAERPEYFFVQDKDEWERVEYRFTVPPMLRGLPRERLVRDVEHMLRDEHRAVLSTKQRFKGVKAVLATDPFDSPNNQRTKDGINPTVVGGKDKQLMMQAKNLIRRFRQAYRAAWKSYVDGIETVFPAGTYLMRRRHGVRCDDLCVPWSTAARLSG